MVRSMLYATDLGLYAPYVTQHALALARTFDAELYVIHVVEPMGPNRCCRAIWARMR